MKQVNIKGIITPVLTPMNEDESVNAAELRRQVKRQIESGIHALFCFGTNGEGYILNVKEKQFVLETVIEEAAGRVPVYAGTGCNGTRETIEQSRMAAAAGADALSIISPGFALASQNEIFDHYKAVADAVDMPIVLYNIPARTGNTIAPATVERLQKACANIIGAKDSSGNFDNTLQYIEATREHGVFGILSGNDSLILWTLMAGGAGGIAGCGNVYPKTMASIYEAFASGDLDKARKYQDSIRSFRACFKYGNPNTVVKTAVGLLGYDVGKCRAPFNQLSAEGIEAIKKVLAENAEKGMS